MDIGQALREAAEIVEGAELRAEYRVAAFEKTLVALLELGSVRGGTAPASMSSELEPANVGAQGPLAAIAHKLGVDGEVISEVYELRDGAIDVILAHSRIAEGMSAGARQIAMLVAAGRQAAGLEADGWTEAGEIREICKEFGKYDQANFSSTLGNMHDYFSMSGRGATRKVRLTRAGWEFAKRLIEELTA
jgi:hypothetical protein